MFVTLGTFVTFVTFIKHNKLSIMGNDFMRIHTEACHKVGFWSKLSVQHKIAGGYKRTFFAALRQARFYLLWQALAAAA